MWQSSKTGNAVMPPRSWCQYNVKSKLTKRNVCCVITALSISYIYRQVISLNSLNILLHVYYQYVHVWICMDSTVFHITPLPLMINCKPSWGFLHPSKSISWNSKFSIPVASCLNKATTKPQDLGEHHRIIEISPRPPA